MNVGMVLGSACGLMCLFLILGAAAPLQDLLLFNAGVQSMLFAFVACIPFLRTGRMSYVDIAWPFGVALVGVQIMAFGEADWVRRMVVGGIYVFIGLRMGIAALVLGRSTGIIFRTEFPRYQYRRMVLEEERVKYPQLHMLCEIIAQGLANMSVLALPGFIIATYGQGPVSFFEILGLVIWCFAYILESIADGQKMLFIANNKEGVCDVGLWRYSRHPNYFSEWLVWTGLVAGSVSGWWHAGNHESLTVWIMLGVGALGASVTMFITLVYLTGAKPAEHYSVKKRQGYVQYQKTTNMFFPWFPKKGAR